MLNTARTAGLRILARRDALTDTDWFNLIEERRALIEPHLRDMTLKSLGDLKIVRDYQGGHRSERPLRMGAMVEETYSSPPYHKYRKASELKIAKGPFSLDTRGIFPDDDVYYNGHFKWEHIYRGDGQAGAIGLTIWFWGLTRNNEWLKAVCTEKYFTQPLRAGVDEREEQRSEVVKFIATESTPEEICLFCDITPQWMWQRLGDAIEAWVKHRRHLLSDAERLVEVINHEKMMLGIITSK